MFGRKKKTEAEPPGGGDAPEKTGKPEKKGKTRLLLFLVAGALGLAGTGLAIWFFYPAPSKEEVAEVEPVPELPPPVISGHLSLGSITVPIAGIEEERWQLRASVDVMVDADGVEARIRERFDEIRAILQSIAAGYSKDRLMTTAGKLDLKYAWFAAMNRAMAPEGLRALYITDLLLLPLDEAPTETGPA